MNGFYDPAYSSYFYLKSDGSYANQEWQKVDGKWYYFKKWGYMAKDEWQGNYYLTESGAMATGELVMNDARYIFSDSGELKEKKDLNVGWVHRNSRRYFFNQREEQVGTDQVKKVIDVSEHNGRISDWKKSSTIMALMELLFVWAIVELRTRNWLIISRS